MDTAASIPFTAWEQAVFVALFILLVIALLSWFTRQQRSWQDFMNDQNKRWQESIDKQNMSWQSWLDAREDRECDSLQKVTDALDRLTLSQNSMTEKLLLHDAKVEDRFANAIRVVNGTKQTPKKAKTV